MQTPLTYLTTLQLSAFEGWTKMAYHTLAYWQRCFEMQSKLFNPPREQRPHLQVAKGAAHEQRSHLQIAKGAALTDLYGKRARDIDPEKSL